MQHDRRFSAVILRNIARIETLGHVRIVLQGAALPGTSQAVEQRKLDLRAVERALTRQILPRQTGCVQRTRQRSFGAIPERIVSDTLLRAR